MKDRVFQIFGSKTSTDYDVMIFVDEIPNIEESKKLCHKWNKKLYMKFVDEGMEIKTLNCNIGVLENNVLIDVFKGTVDEVNNSLIDTYDLHQQFYPQQIQKRLKRDLDIKIMRSARFMLMYLSSSDYRFDVKKALKSNFVKKIKTLENIDLSKTHDLGEKSVDWKDYLKSMSFQISQCLALFDDVELYTKEDLSKRFPDLEPMIMRTGEDLNILEKYKNEFIRKCKIHLKNMKSLNE